MQFVNTYTSYLQAIYIYAIIHGASNLRIATIRNFIFKRRAHTPTLSASTTSSLRESSDIFFFCSASFVSRTASFCCACCNSVAVAVRDSSAAVACTCIFVCRRRINKGKKNRVRKNNERVRKINIRLERSVYRTKSRELSDRVNNKLERNYSRREKGAPLPELS